MNFQKPFKSVLGQRRVKYRDILVAVESEFSQQLDCLSFSSVLLIADQVNLHKVFYSSGSLSIAFKVIFKNQLLYVQGFFIDTKNIMTETE